MRTERTNRRSTLCVIALAFTAALLPPGPSVAQTAPPQVHPQAPTTATAPATRPDGLTMAEAERAMQDKLMKRVARRSADKAAQYLVQSQEQSGGWASEQGPRISALVLKALIQAPGIGPQHSAVQRGLEFVRRHRREDGGVYGPEGLYKNYESSVVLSMLATLKDPALAPELAALQKFVKDLQWDESEDKAPSDPWYGGAGYGRGQRPDLSNTQMMLEALRDSGVPADDPAYRKALVFVQRCQMLGERNDQPFARGSTQGGFIYSPANGGESKGGTVEIDGRSELRCVGSMTYAGFKSMLYAGLTREDPRVLAALEWIRRNWTLQANPNMPPDRPREGLYYYYHVFARALAAFGEEVIVDHAGRQHAWRHELVHTLARAQQPDGSWTNDADRYMEGIPALTTAYALLAIQAAYPPER